jgi:hypothetical protein
VRDSIKYPDDMVVISWMCSDGSRRAPIKIPKRVPFLRERERGREIDEAMVRFEKKGTAYLT